MKLISQLLREFWFPFTIAIAWTAYNFYPTWMSAEQTVKFKDSPTAEPATAAITPIFEPQFSFLGKSNSGDVLISSTRRTQKRVIDQ